MQHPDWQKQTAAAWAAEIETRLNALPDSRVGTVRTLRREFSKRLSHEEPGLIIEVALRLLAGDDIVHRLVAYELVASHKAALHSLSERELEQLGNGIDSWEDVDTFACSLSGQVWRADQVPDTLIERWAHSPDRWWRRAALVSTVPLNNRAQGGKGDTARTLHICRLLAADRDDMVYKALSWALRQLAIHDAQAVRDFLQEQQGVLAARVVREVQNKLTTGLKNPRKKALAVDITT
jgi:3-methyladenine DNA glycosylase AlkD